MTFRVDSLPLEKKKANFQKMVDEFLFKGYSFGVSPAFLYKACSGKVKAKNIYASDKDILVQNKPL